MFYGEISLGIGLGRLITDLLMIVGIGFIGMINVTIVTYFLYKSKKYEKINKENITLLDISGLSKDNT